MALDRSIGPATTAVRWDLAGLVQVAGVCEAKADTLLYLRELALGVGEQGGSLLDMRQAVVAAHWGHQAATAIRSRRLLLAIAENSLAAELGAIDPIEPAGWRPELKSRPIETIEADLDAALAAGREAAAAKHTLEMVQARRDQELMTAEPHLPTVARLQSIMDFLAYE